MLAEIYIDGASAGNPGPSGIGIFIKYDGKVEFFSIPVGPMSNHEAEFSALIEGMKICLQKGLRTVSFRTDSQVVDRAANAGFAKNPAFKRFIEDMIELQSQFDLFFIKWIPSKENQVADELARKAIHLSKG
ncbi:MULTISPECIES: reverse transcriptase-like protein [unclassified Bacillus (in: firmicutes)]|uniref:reverse transcriptase-like protein n=1 Tax=Bacillus TaxID=1386 RepID=UPI00338FFF2E